MKKITLLTTLSVAILLTACGNITVPSASMPETIKIQNTERNVITVNASNEVKVIPDIAKIVYGIYTEAPKAADCQTKNTEKVNQVIALLKELGVDEKSIQTSGYQLSPSYDWSDNVQKLVGYEMRTTLTISELPLDKIGAVLTESVNAGINDIDSITYQSSTYDESYQEALKLAIATAKAKGEAMAEAGECILGGAVRIEEYENYSEARNTTYTDVSAAMLKEAAVEDSANVMPGEVSIEAKVTVDFLIQ